MVITTKNNNKKISLKIENNLKKMFERLNNDFIKNAFSEELKSPKLKSAESYFSKNNNSSIYYFDEYIRSESITEKRIFLDLISGEIIVLDGNNREFIFVAADDSQKKKMFGNLENIRFQRTFDKFTYSNRFELFTNNELKKLLVDSVIFKEINFLFWKQTFINNKKTVDNITKGIKDKIQNLLLNIIGFSEQPTLEKKKFSNKLLFREVSDDKSKLIDFSLRLGPSSIFQEEFSELFSVFGISVFDFCNLQNFIFNSIPPISSNFLYSKKFNFYYHLKSNGNFKYYRNVFLENFINYFINHSDKIEKESGFYYLENFALNLKEYISLEGNIEKYMNNKMIRILSFILKNNPNFFKKMDESFLHNFNQCGKDEKISFLSRYIRLNKYLKRMFFSDCLYINLVDILNNSSFMFESEFIKTLEKLSFLLEQNDSYLDKELNVYIKQPLEILYKYETYLYFNSNFREQDVISQLTYSISDLLSKFSDNILKLQKNKILPESLNINIVYGSDFYKSAIPKNNKEIRSDLSEKLKKCSNTIGANYEEYYFNNAQYFSISKNLKGNNIKISASLSK